MDFVPYALIVFQKVFLHASPSQQLWLKITEHIWSWLAISLCEEQFLMGVGYVTPSHKNLLIKKKKLLTASS